jgi:hypothetical protein
MICVLRPSRISIQSCASSPSHWTSSRTMTSGRSALAKICRRRFAQPLVRINKEERQRLEEEFD